MPWFMDAGGGSWGFVSVQQAPHNRATSTVPLLRFYVLSLTSFSFHDCSLYLKGPGVSTLLSLLTQ